LIGSLTKRFQTLLLITSVNGNGDHQGIIVTIVLIAVACIRLDGPVELMDAIVSKKLPDATFSTVDAYFDAVEKSNLPVVKEELQHHARGCYSAVSYVKEMNRKCEENLLEAERYALLANR
jgi:hypothetical protein